MAIIEKKCAVCPVTFFQKGKTKSQHLMGGFRSSKSVTCSPKCSKVFARALAYLKGRGFRSKNEMIKENFETTQRILLEMQLNYNSQYPNKIPDMKLIIEEIKKWIKKQE